jgi:tetratricopeptide (TPR) repeat protein
LVGKDGSLERMKRFLRAELSRQDNLLVVRRLLEERTGSPKTTETDRPGSLAERRNALEEENRYAEAFRRVTLSLDDAQARLAREKTAAPGQWVLLEPHPQARRQVMIRNDKRFQSWGLFDFLLQKAREAADRDPRSAVALAELADTIAGNLDPVVHGAERVADFQAAALGALGNARRLTGDLTGARVAFQQARVQLELGTGDPLEDASLSTLLANLLCELGDYEKAAQALERAAALARRFGEPQFAGLDLPQSLRELEAQKRRCRDAKSAGA